MHLIPDGPRRVAVTGGAGFVGRAVIRALVDRGVAVTALVRDPSRVPHLTVPGVTVAASDLSSGPAVTDAIRGSDALIHAAGAYRIGIAASERPAMWDANVGTTERVLDAAIAAGVRRIVYVSTCNVFGNTRGSVVDETYRRDLAEGFLSWYDETKFRAHEVAEARIAAGAPMSIALPSQVYGPHDHSQASAQLADAFAGRLRYLALADCGLAWVHVDDLARGIVAVLDRGTAGESYCLAGEPRRLDEAVAIAARAGGRRPPRLTVPTGLLRALVPVNRLVRLPGLPADLAETIRSSAGVTYWASAAKAGRELGFTARPLEQGLRDTFAGVLA